MSRIMNAEEKKAWDDNPNTTLSVCGVPFSCPCGCNVFGHVDYDKDQYACNSCGTTFTGSGGKDG